MVIIFSFFLLYLMKHVIQISELYLYLFIIILHHIKAYRLVQQ